MQKTEILNIWSENKPRLMSFISQKIKRETDKHDISQEVFIKLWVNYQDIKDKNKILNWLYSVARFTIADYYRKKENMFSPILIQEDYTNLNQDNEVYSEESKKLIPIINSLPVKFKTVLLMSDIYELSHKEIAQQFDLTISCIKTRVIRARKLLAERMQECCSFSYDKYGNIINCTERQAYFDCLKKNEEKD